MNIFIASSSESLNYAEALKALLEETNEYNVTIWKDASFNLGETIIESLEKIKKLFDYAIFVFYPDDEINFRTEKMKSVRDNVIFEFGLFVGVLGRFKCYAIVPENLQIKQPSDLLGVNLSRYKYIKNDANLKSTLRTSANNIRKAIEDNLDSPSKNSKLIRGDFRDSIVDMSVNVSLVDSDLYKQWLESMKRGERVKEELLYWDRQTANRWLEYEKFTIQSFDLIQNMGEKLKNLLSAPFDLISLGPGSGAKDIAFLSSVMMPRGVYWYYPIDISSHLLFHAMKSVTEQFDDTRLKVKGIRANFNSLEKLKFVYRYTSNKNVFTLLGNTLGNYNEQEIVTRIKNSMYPGDFFIVEINNIESYDPNQGTKYKNKNYGKFILEPLKALGIVPKASNLKFEESKNNISSVNRAKRISANYYFDDAEIQATGLEIQLINITYSTHYNKNEVVDFIQGNGLSFEFESSNSNSIILVFRK